MIPDTASGIEILLIVLGVALLGVNVWGVAWALHDLAWLRKRRGMIPIERYTALDILARQTRRNELLRLAKQGIYTSCWVVFAAVPPPIRATVQFAGWYITGALLAGQVLLAYSSIACRLDMLRLVRTGIRFWPAWPRQPREGKPK